MASETTHVAMTVSDHLPILQVVIPMLMAPVCVVIGSRSLGWPLAFAASLAASIISVLLLLQTLDGSVITYHIGGWAPPLGIEYRIDAANAFVLFLVSLISTIVLVYARYYVGEVISASKHALFYACYLLCLSGLLGVAATGDAFNTFVFLEISSLSTYVLIAMGAERDRRALTSAFDYLVMGTIGATFFVIGVGFLYMATGTLNMVDISERIADMPDNRTVRAAFAFIIVGMGLKVAIYPLHLWLPGAYVHAPSIVTSFLAATSTKVAVYVLLRFVFSVFKPDFVFETYTLVLVILPFAILAMFAASIVSVFQTNLKRLLAYSSIAQIGYMLLGISMISKTGLTATVIHLFNHGITKGALFMAVGAYVLRTGNSFFDRLEGLGKLMPWTSAAFVVGGVSLIGVPGTAGFISKWVLVQAALEKGWWPVALMIVASSLLAVIYVWKAVEVLYMREAPKGARHKEAPISLLVPMWILAIASVYFGIDTNLTLTAAQTAAENLISGY